MKFEDIFELLTYDWVVEVLGIIFAIGLIFGVFFGGMLNPLLEILIGSLG